MSTKLFTTNMLKKNDQQNILVFRIGQLGDSLSAVPALWSLRENFPNSQITLLSDEHVYENYLTSKQVLDGSGLVDKFLFYRVYKTRSFLTLIEFIKLFILLRRLTFDKLVYLMPSRRTNKQVKRDLLFFKLCGIKNILGEKGFKKTRIRSEIGNLPLVEKESENLIARLKLSGLNVPKRNKGRKDLALTDQEKAFSMRWISSRSANKKVQYMALGIGSKMSAKRWPFFNFVYVVEKMIERYDIHPIIFGGNEDALLAQELIEKVGRGHVAAGSLNIRESSGVMSHCEFYLGNDTGTMHLAACSNISCITIYSARDFPGAWYPYGSGHVNFRKSLPCEGCMLETCEIEKLKCLSLITKEEVLEACSQIMSNLNSQLISK